MALSQEDIVRLSQKLADGDRGGFYWDYYKLTGEYQAMVQGQITTYSGTWGGMAMVGNYLAKLADQKNYELTLDKFSTDIIAGTLAEIANDFDQAAKGEDGILSQLQMQISDYETWKAKGLGDLFPGNMQFAMSPEGWLFHRDQIFTEGTANSLWMGFQNIDIFSDEDYKPEELGNRFNEFQGERYERIDLTGHPESDGRFLRVIDKQTGHLVFIQDTQPPEPFSSWIEVDIPGVPIPSVPGVGITWGPEDYRTALSPDTPAYIARELLKAYVQADQAPGVEFISNQIPPNVFFIHELDNGVRIETNELWHQEILHKIQALDANGLLDIGVRERLVSLYSREDNKGIEDFLIAMERRFLGQSNPQPVLSQQNYADRMTALAAYLDSFEGNGNIALIVDLSVLSSSEIQDIANQPDSLGMAYRYSLLSLDPLAMVGNAGLYEKHNQGGELELYDKNTGQGSLTQEWIADRAEMLSWLQLARTANSGLDVPVESGSGLHQYFADRASDESVIVGEGFGDGLAQRILFDDDDAHALTGADKDDRLYGMGGNDTLKGEGGKDYLEGGSGNDRLDGGADNDSLLGMDSNDILIGGTGNDTLVGGADNDRYEFSDGDGNDLVIDSDGQGSLWLDGVQLKGGKEALAGAGTWQSEDGKVTYALSTNPDQTHSLYIQYGNNLIRVKDFVLGQLGIKLENGDIAPASPTIEPTLKGDKKPIDFDPTLPGDQTDVDPQGNIKTTDEVEVRKDSLYGGTDNDRIQGLADDDSLYGNKGNDTLEGGTGKDRLEGQEDNDLLIGGEGADILSGAEGDDWLYAAEQVSIESVRLQTQGSGLKGDWLAAGLGNDVLVGDIGNDVQFGGGGKDTLFGGAGDDVLVGDNDYVATSFDWKVDDRTGNTTRWFSPITYDQHAIEMADSDFLYGGAGNDFLAGLDGKDWLFGESGQDTLLGDSGDDLLFGGDDNDILAGDHGRAMTKDDSSFSITTGDDTLDGGAGDDWLQGEAGDDLLIGGANNDTLHGDADYLEGGMHGSDQLEGGLGNDRLYGEGGNDALYGGDDNDLLIGDELESLLVSRFHGNDSLSGGAGQDTLVGSGGNDELHGGSENDLLQGDAAISELAASAHGQDVLHGDAGNDTLLGNGGHDTLYGGADDDYLDGDSTDVPLAFQGNDYLDGGVGNDTLHGRDGNDTLVGGSGLDHLNGGLGNDLYILNAGDSLIDSSGSASRYETLVDEGGTNRIRFGAGISLENLRITQSGSNAQLDFGPGQGVIIVNGMLGTIGTFEFADGNGLSWSELSRRLLEQQVQLSTDASGANLSGGQQADALLAMAGGNSFEGGRGDDVLVGGGGSNTYLFQLGDGADHIYDAHHADQPNLLRFAVGISAGDLSLDLEDGALVLRIAGGSDAIHIHGFDPDSVLTQPVIGLFEFADGSSLTLEQLLASGLVLNGTEGADLLEGANLPEQLEAGAGDDTLKGYAGNDSLLGGTGDDLLDGGQGDDLLVGGEGQDAYLVYHGSGRDSIVEEGGQVSRLKFAAVQSLDALVARVDGDDLIVELRGSDDGVRIQGGAATMADWTLLAADGSVLGSAETLIAAPPSQAESAEELRQQWLADARAFIETDWMSGDSSGLDRFRPLGDGWYRNVSTFANGSTSDYRFTVDSAAVQSDALVIDRGVYAELENVWTYAERIEVVNFGLNLSSGGAASTGHAYLQLELLTEIWNDPSAWSSAGMLTLPNSGQVSRDDFFSQLLNYATYASGGQSTENPSLAIQVRHSLTTATERAGIINGGDASQTIYTYGFGAVDAGGGDDAILATGGGSGYGIGSPGQFLDGGDGNDTILGTYDADWLLGGNGNNFLSGGQGNDVYYIDPSWSGQQLIDEVLNGLLPVTVNEQMGDEYAPVETNKYVGYGDRYSTDTLQFGAGVTLASMDIASGSLEASALLSQVWGAATLMALDFSWGGSGSVRLLLPTDETSFPGEGYGVEYLTFADGSRYALMSDAVIAAINDDDHDYGLTSVGASRLRFGSAADDVLTAANNGEAYAGLEGNDSILGGTGNDTLLGGAGNDTLNGGLGTDLLSGGVGNDIYVVNDLSDRVVEALDAGVDTVKSSIHWVLGDNLENLTLTGSQAIDGVGNALNNSLHGNTGNNLLRGEAGNDTLNGGLGADSLYGGTGDDVYVVDNLGDSTIESAGEGLDRVNSSISWTLGDNLENLILTGSAAIDGTGNELNNSLTGNAVGNLLHGEAGKDTLNGGLGADTLYGGTGDDVYGVDNLGDSIIEYAGEGLDRVNSSISWALGDNLENLTLTGSAAIDGSGNELDNMLRGNAVDNLLWGGAGNDSLQGAAGNDTYLLGRGDGIDRVVENDATADNSDLALFGENISQEQLWFRRTANHLEVSIIGSGDKLIVQNWYLGEQYQIERFQTADGHTLLDSQVQNLVSAMASFAPPAADQTTMPENYQASLASVIAANWQ